MANSNSNRTTTNSNQTTTNSNELPDTLKDYIYNVANYHNNPKHFLKNLVKHGCGAGSFSEEIYTDEINDIFKKYSIEILEIAIDLDSFYDINKDEPIDNAIEHLVFEAIECKAAELLIAYHS